MNRMTLKNILTLSIAPSANDLGFAVMENGRLIDWGNKQAKGDKNKDSLAKVEKLIVRYLPDVIVLQDVKGSRRGLRIRKLIQQIQTLAGNKNIKVKLLSREQVMRIFFPDGQGTKYALTKLVAQKFPEELGDRLPPPRKPWKSEDSRMDIFDAVALADHTQLTYPSRLILGW